MCLFDDTKGEWEMRSCFFFPHTYIDDIEVKVRSRTHWKLLRKCQNEVPTATLMRHDNGRAFTMKVKNVSNGILCILTYNMHHEHSSEDDEQVPSHEHYFNLFHFDPFIIIIDNFLKLANILSRQKAFTLSIFMCCLM